MFISGQFVKSRRNLDWHSKEGKSDSSTVKLSFVHFYIYTQILFLDSL